MIVQHSYNHEVSTHHFTYSHSMCACVRTVIEVKLQCE